jgi:hypothetical protein
MISVHQEIPLITNKQFNFILKISCKKALDYTRFNKKNKIDHEKNRVIPMMMNMIPAIFEMSFRSIFFDIILPK